MNELLQLWQRPETDETYMLAGWRQWADAGNMSSGLLRYLLELTGATRIGVLQPTNFYLFQVPGTHHFLRPDVELEDGLVKAHETRSNEFHYWRSGNKGIVAFLGDEPHLNAELYADTWLDAVEQLGVKRVICLGGVYGSMPYDREREIHAVYSLPRLKAELDNYALKYSNYEGGSTIGTYLAYRAGQRGIELIDLYAFVPAYDFSQISNQVQGLRIDSDFQAWFDVMRRIKHMFDLEIDLSDMELRSLELASSMDVKVEEVSRKYPKLKVKEFMQQLTDAFEELPFMPLDDLWARELGDLLDDLDG
jgi:proteasome assembly chaperone (PAC2) family protein